MKRLTEKTYCGYDVKDRKLRSGYTDDEIFKILQTLGKLEDLVETLKRNLCFYGSCIDFYRDEEKNINTKIDITDYEIIEEWLKND